MVSYNFRAVQHVPASSRMDDFDVAVLSRRRDDSVFFCLYCPRRDDFNVACAGASNVRILMKSVLVRLSSHSACVDAQFCSVPNFAVLCAVPLPIRHLRVHVFSNLLVPALF